MAQRIMDMRGLLRQNLEQLGSPHNWQHITDQVCGTDLIGVWVWGGGGIPSHGRMGGFWVFLLGRGPQHAVVLGSHTASRLATARPFRMIS